MRTLWNLIIHAKTRVLSDTNSIKAYAPLHPQSDIEILTGPSLNRCLHPHPIFIVELKLEV